MKHWPIKNLILVLALSLFTVNFASASTLIEKAKDDSCIGGEGTSRWASLNGLGALLMWISNDFYMVGDKAETPESCSIPLKEGEGVKYCYEPSLFGVPIGTKKQCNSIAHNQDAMLGALPIRGQNIGDMMCIQALSIIGYVNIGCKYREPPKPTAINHTQNLKCYIAEACTTRILSESQSLIPITAPIVKCVEESIKAYFMGKEGCSDSLLQNFQDNLRRVVTLLLTIYVMFFGLKIALGKELPQKSEIFVFICKICAVIYFSVGIRVGDDLYHGVYDIYNFFMGIMQDLVMVSLEVGKSPTGLCLFDGNSDVAMWDSIDCRIAFYLGLNRPDTLGIGAAFIASFLLLGIFPIVGVLGGALGLAALALPFTFMFAFMVGLLVFALLVISVVVHVVHTYLVAMIIVTIAVFTAPLFVPMVLFQWSKRMFDAWLRAIFGYAFQPMILFLFLGFMFNIFDKIIYPECKFIPDPNIETVVSTMNEIGFQIPSGVKLWVLDKDSGDSTQNFTCRSSFGAFIQTIFTLGIVDFVHGQASLDIDFSRVITSGILVIIFAFIFYFFINLVGSIAADLSGAVGLSSMAVGGTFVLDKAIDTAVKATMAAINLAMTAASAATGGAAGAVGKVAMGAAKQVGSEVARATASHMKEAAGDGPTNRNNDSAGSNGRNGSNGSNGSNGNPPPTNTQSET
ncbi:TrbL/VirB6 family protein [Rickettsiales endosymbiont of Stachyamoeba lipophora]|uniref:type IV secretion system protein n=1 Tax=Rickettsiales endosymbiont of Stachyamoeba lipophora TaxID=2486578 RepID=UPI000F6554B6|nr:type IV secretion system protein [Rickettsiales endosymbiont of Stachyamoeba lipophora]AZL15806.1 hypothetical protein EF513_04510 [Rickettsiales endosymbiont of Stachyamoeba lipophora]